MKEARDAVPRKEGENRSQWKSRVFQNKRKMEEEAAKEQRRKGLLCWQGRRLEMEVWRRR